MGRTIEFNQSTATDKALVLFWRKGYQATSLADLLAAMNISRSSFYATFVDKRSLFLVCLDLFAARTLQHFKASTLSMSPIDALENFFTRQITPPVSVEQHAKPSQRHWGCMMVNTVLEMADVDDALSAHASKHLDVMQRTMELCLLATPCPPAKAAEFAAMLMLLNQGVRVSSRRKLTVQAQLLPIQTTFALIRSAIG